MKGFAIDISFIHSPSISGVRADHDGMHSDETGPTVREYLADVDDAAIAAAIAGLPKRLDATDPWLRWTKANREQPSAPALFGV